MGEPPGSFDREHQESWSRWVLGQARLPAIPDLLGDGECVPVAFWKGADQAAVLHLRRVPADGGWFVETDIEGFCRGAAGWELAASGGGGWTQDSPLIPQLSPRAVELHGMVSGGLDALQLCTALWGEVGQDAAVAEIEQRGVVTRAAIVAPVGAVVFCADGRFPFEVRVYDRAGELLGAVSEPAFWRRGPVSLPGSANPGPRLSLSTRTTRRGEAAVPKLTASEAVRLAGFDERYAEVPYLTERDGLAIAVIDTNGDGREVTAILFEHLADGGWVDVVDPVGSGFTDTLVWECGSAPTERFVIIRHAGTDHQVPVAPNGMWYFAARRQPDHPISHLGPA
jgi:hypothetical protein